MRVVATSGHVDHGKSTLVRALTGHEPDRLAEEQRRGLTIDIGFAWTLLDGVGEVAFVDVPGHVDFLRNMIAGVAVIDAAVLVVDAGEGWRPQTHEHLRILRALGVGPLVAAVTKAGTVDRRRCDEVVAQTGRLLGEVGLQTVPVVACEALAGTGMDDLRAALVAVLADVAPPRDRDRPRLWIDRSFTIRGAGTVVTGGLTDGTLHVGDQVRVIGNNRAIEARIRGIEALGEGRESASPGGRTALNLARVDHRTIRRGSVLVRDGDWHLTDVIDAELHVSASLAHGVTRRGAYSAHLGTAAMAAPVRIIGGDEIAPGERGLVRIHLTHRLPLVPGDRYVLVESGRSEVIGGGEVLDVDPILPLRRARPDRSVARVVAERGSIDVDWLERLTGQPAAPTIGWWVMDPDELESQRRALLDLINSAGPTGTLLDSLDDLRRALVEDLQSRGSLEVRGGIVLAAGQRDELDDHPFLAQLRAAPFQPPTPAECGVHQPTVMELRRRGLITSLEGLHFATTAIDESARIFARLAAAHPDGVTIAQFRDALGTTRKWAMPILAHLDAIGVSRRCRDLRRIGPRLASRGPNVPSSTR